MMIILNFDHLQKKKKWEKKDPLNYFRRILLKKKSNLNKIIKIEKDINNKLNETFKFARKSKYPKLKTTLRKNYSNEFSNVVKKFYNNNADFSTIQEKHLPKPY